MCAAFSYVTWEFRKLESPGPGIDGQWQLHGHMEAETWCLQGPVFSLQWDGYWAWSW